MEEKIKELRDIICQLNYDCENKDKIISDLTVKLELSEKYSNDLKTNLNELLENIKNYEQYLKENINKYKQAKDECTNLIKELRGNINNFKKEKEILLRK